MADELFDDLEFTEEQLHKVLRSVGEEARRSAFAKGQPVIFLKGRSIVALHPDGREEIIEILPPETSSTSLNS